MASFSVIEHLDVVEYIGPGLVPRSIANPMDTFAFERSEEALHSSIVPTIARPTRAALDPVLGELIPEVITGILATTIRVVNELSLRFPCVDCHS